MSRGAMISAKVEAARVKQGLTIAEKDAYLSAASAINRAMMKARTVATKEIATENKIAPIRLIRKRMRIDKMTSTAVARRDPSTGSRGVLRMLLRSVSVAQLQGVIDTGAVGTVTKVQVTRGKRKLTMKYGRENRAFGERQVGRNLRVQTGRGVRAYGGRVYPKAFLAHGKGGVWLAFERQGMTRKPLTALKVELANTCHAVFDRLRPQIMEWAKANFVAQVNWRQSMRKG